MNIYNSGKGNDEVISEALAMKNYLLKQGINENSILIEDKSKNTFENISYSEKLIDNTTSKVAFSTTNYHVFRAGAIAFNQGYNLEGIGAKTKTYFWVNAFIREFIATLVYDKRKHILALLSILFFAIIIIYMRYLTNII